MTTLKLEIPQEKENGFLSKKTNTFTPKVVLKEEYQEVKKLDLGKNIFMRVLQNSEGTVVDIRRYYKGYPTKKGVRFSSDMLKLIKEFIDQ